MDVINQYTKICIGKDSLEELKKIKNSTILIVSDEFLVKNSIIDKLIENIDKSNKFKVFDKVQPDPSLKIIGEDIKVYFDNFYLNIRESIGGAFGFVQSLVMSFASFASLIYPTLFDIKLFSPLQFYSFF